MRIKRKYHYIVMALVVLFPMIVIVCSLLSHVSGVASTYIDNVGAFYRDFMNADINSWYVSLMSYFGIDLASYDVVINCVLLFPLYYIYVLIFDLILDIFSCIFELPHKLVNKVGDHE